MTILTEVAQKERFVDDTLATIEAGTPFEQAVSVTQPFVFSGGDLGWRKLGDIPSMFAEVIPTLDHWRRHQGALILRFSPGVSG